MYPIDFHKNRALCLLDCIRKGHPIQPTLDFIWTDQDLITVAAVCQAAIRFLGPPEFRVQYQYDLSKIADALDCLHPEHREFVERQCDADILAAIDLSSHLTRLADAGCFDEHFEPNVRALVGQEIVARKIISLKGFRT